MLCCFVFHGPMLCCWSYFVFVLWFYPSGPSVVFLKVFVVSLKAVLVFIHSWGVMICFSGLFFVLTVSFCGSLSLFFYFGSCA